MSRHPLTCLQLLQDSTHTPNLYQAASESVVGMILEVETVASEEVYGIYCGRGRRGKGGRGRGGHGQGGRGGDSGAYENGIDTSAFIR